MSDYTPTVETFRGVYGQMCAEWCRDDALAEFDRFIARIKADALREAADEYATSNRVQTHGVTSVLMFMHHRADRIEKEETMSEYTAEDFKNAKFAVHRDGAKAVRWELNYRAPWHTAIGDRFLDEQMVENGWRPVREHAPLTLDSAVREMQEKAWDEGYRRGVDDERIAEATQVGIGLGGVATPNRTSPYRRDER